MPIAVVREDSATALCEDSCSAAEDEQCDEPGVVRSTFDAAAHRPKRNAFRRGLTRVMTAEIFKSSNLYYPLCDILAGIWGT